MWIMTSYGILMPAAIPAHVTNDEGRDSNGYDLQIRARERHTLEKVRKSMKANGAIFGRIVATPANDYEYRFHCDRDDFATVMAEEIAAINYDKFKPTTLRKGGGGERLHSLYNAIWFAVAEHYDSPILGGYRTRGAAKATRRRPWYEDLG